MSNGVTRVLVLLLAACSKSEPAATTHAAGSAGSATATAPSGFSASLSASLAKEGVKAPGSSSATAAAAGSATAAAAGSATATATGSATAAGPASSHNAGVAAAQAADTDVPAPDLEHREHVKVPPDIAAIKLDLDPDWDRDLGEGQTISFVLRVPNTNAKKLFVFHYGYEDPSAPGDPDAYVKWLTDHKVMTTVTLNRQNGAALLVEGKDPTGDEVFRAIVTYGGKKLVCYGSRYRTPAYNPLGDLRDKVVMAAEKICETLAL
jgi:hypothetical protein